MLPFGRVTAADLSDQVLARAARRVPRARFVAGDFMTLEFGEAAYDVAGSLEVLAHVANQQAFLGRIARLLRPGGHLLLATQNRPILELNRIPLPAPGQLRKWMDRRELRQLLARISTFLACGP
ncbi:bifunctional 2-polyprenyl-6-hydroxyphenol methylase/3-demethylubiquinol 3-O-methyltransferase UbiG [Roseomonas sp. HF4]|uniref:class I SAM-dependent methyltransferase n=1 Tax=Roseomonas sp. HF4 TaxID=2562313 RepID=UPI00197E1FC7|nr:methyltransferase domain-containing protein [Roseomonas sp. HF4]